MRRTPARLLTGAALVLALGAAGCSRSEHPSTAQPDRAVSVSPVPSPPASVPASPGPSPAPAAPPDPALLARGKALYTEHCATCHMVDGSGVPGMQPALVDAPFVGADPTVLAKIVLRGSVVLQRAEYQNEMPGFASLLDDAQIAALASFVRTEFGGKPTTVSAAQVAEVRADKS